MRNLIVIEMVFYHDAEDRFGEDLASRETRFSENERERWDLFHNNVSREFHVLRIER